MKGKIMTNIKTDRAIGLEREFDNLTPSALQHEINTNHPHLNYLRVIRDGSLPNGGEVVFPPLSFKAESTWQISSEVNDIIIRLGGRVTTSCGHHVHVGLKPITMDAEEFNTKSIAKFRQNKYFQDSNDAIQFEVIKDICFRYAKHQQVINSFLAPSRRDSRYARNMTDRVSRIENCTNLAQLQSVCGGKFNAINISHIESNGGGKGTIEFRQHQGTLNNTKLKNFVEFIVTLVDYSHHERFSMVNQGTRYNETLLNNMPYNSKLYKVFALCQNPNGATTQEIMSQCGINDARSVRRTINTIRRKIGCTQCVVTLNQEFYGHLNGSSNGQYDLNGYKIPNEIQRISNGTIQLNNNNDCIWSNIREDLKTWLQNRFTT
jgi:hypothetical protein